jgi:ubiquinone/menaquinone biosynthesis C-methylase UbiE
MLAHARRRAEELPVDATLDVADVEDLPYDDDRFDTATATCVFCSVADPIQGLRELARVTKPDRRVLLLEHVRPRNRVLGALADLVSPLTQRLFGPEVNRHTERNVEAAGLEIVSVRREGVWREIEAHPRVREA